MPTKRTGLGIAGKLGTPVEGDIVGTQCWNTECLKPLYSEQLCKSQCIIFQNAVVKEEGWDGGGNLGIPMRETDLVNGIGAETLYA